MYLSNYSATTLHLILMWSSLHVTSSEIRRRWVSVCTGARIWFLICWGVSQLLVTADSWICTQINKLLDLVVSESSQIPTWVLMSLANGKNEGVWEFHSWFFIGSCTVSWLVLKLWIKRADPSNLNKSESYRMVTSVTGVTWGGLWKGNIFFQKIIGH